LADWLRFVGVPYLGDEGDLVIHEGPMDLSSSGPSRRRAFQAEDLAPFLSKIPRFSSARKLISKVSKPSKATKAGQAVHTRLPVVVPSRPGRK